MRKILFWIIFINSVSIFAQKEYYNWYFGFNAAITFDTKNGEPKPLDSALLRTLEGSSSISDSTGKLLFYTDGCLVWDKNHNLLNPDNSLHGHSSSTQSSLIVKKPGLNSEYYIFTADAGGYIIEDDSSNHINRGLKYSIYDANLNSGEIVSYNNPVVSPMSEKLTAVAHFNKHDIWIIAHGWENNTFYKILLTNNGISSIKAQSIGSYIGGAYERTIGYMKLSPNGKYLVYVSEGADYFELFKFDNKTGELSEPLTIFTPGQYFNYGAEFSNSGNKLYISEYKNSTITQYNIEKYNQDSISKSAKMIFQEDERDYLGALQIAPNGKIYFSRMREKYLGVINYPDSSGFSSDPKAQGVYLGNDTDGSSSFGLPNMLQSKFFFDCELTDTTICENYDLSIKPQMNALFDDMKFEWTGPNNFKSNNQIINLKDIKVIDEGIYKLKVNFREFEFFNSLYLKVNINPVAEIIGDSVICGDNPIILKSKYQDSHLVFNWNNGSKESSIIVDKAGTYILKVTNNSGCFDFDTLIVKGGLIDAGFSINSLELNDICIGQKLNHTVYFSNRGKYNLKIKEIKLRNSIPEIQIENHLMNEILLKPDSTITINLTSFSDIPQLITDTLLIFTQNNDCSMTFRLPLNIRFMINNKFEIGNYKQTPGDYIHFAINYLNECKGNSEYFDELRFNFSYHNDYFYLDSLTGAKILEEYDNDYYHTLILDSDIFDLNKKSDELVKFYGTILVGGDDLTNLTISDFDWANDLIRTNVDNGTLKIDACAVPIRPIKLFKPNKLIIDRQTDSELVIKVQSEATGNHFLKIFDIYGNLLTRQEFIRNMDSPVINIINIDISGLSSGTYFFVLSNSTNKTLLKHFILK